MKRLLIRLKILENIRGFNNKLIVLKYFILSPFNKRFSEKILNKEIIIELEDKIFFIIRKNKPNDLWMIALLENKTFKIIQKMKIRTFIDIGANKGIYTLKLSKRAKKILSIEPQSDNFKILKRNIKLNKFKNVLLKKVACFDKSGGGFISLYEKNDGAHSLVFKRSDKNEKVRLDKLDNIVKEKKLKEIDLIKIDVEGAELNVLMGARTTLQRFKPKIILEILNKEELEKIYKFLNKINYKIEHIEESDYLAYP